VTDYNYKSDKAEGESLAQYTSDLQIPQKKINMGNLVVNKNKPALYYLVSVTGFDTLADRGLNLVAVRLVMRTLLREVTIKWQDKDLVVSAELRKRLGLTIHQTRYAVDQIETSIPDLVTVDRKLGRSNRLRMTRKGLKVLCARTR
jgi:hypothetical protein